MHNATMSVFRLPLDSLRARIVLGYGAVAVLVLVLAGASAFEMRMLARKVTAGERIHQFLGIALEMRRFEKNYLLYGQAEDFAENRTYVAEARRLLSMHGTEFAAVADAEAIGGVLLALEDYQTEFGRLLAYPDKAAEIRFRQAGKRIVSAAEDWSRAERTILQRELEQLRQWLIAGIVVLVLLVVSVGQMLAWRVARPLRELEANMEAVADGRLAKLVMTTRDSEFASLTVAFNHVLEQLETRQGQLLRSEKLAALGTLLSGVAHELNNPLSNISTSCEILAEEFAGPKVGAGDTAFQAELLQQIDAETWRARRIVRSLLDYARDRDFHREPVALAVLVDECLRLLRGRIPAQVDVVLAVPAILTASGDKQRLQQALFNLVGNALDALEGAGELRIAAHPARGPYPPDALVFGRHDTSAAQVEVEIADNGHGIDAATMPRIFDPFFTTKDVGQGLGLGLFIVFEIVEEHGGSIAVKSTPGKGTSVFLRLPAKETPA